MQKIKLSILGIFSAFFGSLGLILPIIKYQINFGLGLISIPVAYSQKESFILLIGIILILSCSHKFRSNPSYYRLLYIGGIILVILSCIEFYIYVIITLEDIIELTYQSGFYFLIICIVLAILNLVLELLYDSYFEQLHWIYINYKVNSKLSILEEETGEEDDAEDDITENYEDNFDGLSLNFKNDFEDTNYYQGKPVVNGGFVNYRLMRIMGITTLLIIITLGIILISKSV